MKQTNKNLERRITLRKKEGILPIQMQHDRVCRCNKVYKPVLQQRQDVCDELAKMSFWSLMKMYMDETLIMSERKKKSDMDLIKIINCYNPGDQKFIFLMS